MGFFLYAEDFAPTVFGDLEGLLDRVESGEAPPSVLGGITGRFLGGGEGRG